MSKTDVFWKWKRRLFDEISKSLLRFFVLFIDCSFSDCFSSKIPFHYVLPFTRFHN